MRKALAVLFSSALLLVVPANALAAGHGYGKTGKAVGNCNVGLTLGGNFTCIIPK